MGYIGGDFGLLGGLSNRGMSSGGAGMAGAGSHYPAGAMAQQQFATTRALSFEEAFQALSGGRKEKKEVAKKPENVREQLQAETDEWLKGVFN